MINIFIKLKKMYGKISLVNILTIKKYVKWKTHSIHLSSTSVAILFLRLFFRTVLDL